MGVDVAFACPSCGTPVEGTLDAGTKELGCARCGGATPLPEAAAIAEGGRVAACCVCGGADLFAQRDFNRTLGLALAGIGLALGPFTHWISAGAAVLLDAGLYLVVPTVVVCYACNAQYRGVPEDGRPAGFDIAVHDAFKFGKRFPPRREAAVAGPRARRLRRQGRPET